MDNSTIGSVVTSAVGTILGGIITWGVARWYYRKQAADTEQQISAVTADARHMTEHFARFLEALSAAVVSGDTVGFARDDRGDYRFNVLKVSKSGADGAIASDDAPAPKVTPAVEREPEDISQ